MGSLLKASMRAVVLAATTYAVAGCASQAQTKVDDTGGKVKGPGVSTTTTDTSGCAGGMSTAPQGAGLLPEGRQVINGKYLKLYTKRDLSEQKSFCQILQESGKKALIMQFSGFDCVGCQDEAKEIEEMLRTSGYSQSILHIVVMTDLYQSFPEEWRFTDFMNKYSPNAMLAYDEAVLWKTFDDVPEDPDRGVAVAMGLSMNGAVINTGDQKLVAKRIFDEAVRLASESSQQTGGQP